MARTSFSELVDRLGLSDEEALQAFDIDALSAVSGALDHRPELPILDTLTAEAAERMGVPALQRWLRAAGGSGRPIELLLAHDFGAFETALGELIEHGLILRGGSAA